MVIYVKCRRVLVMKDGVLLNEPSFKVIGEYNNYHDFGFDVYNADNWKKFLQDFEDSKGRKLPRRYEGNVRVVYNVVMFGVPKELRDKKTRGAIRRFFPDPDNKKTAYKGSDFID